MGQLPGIAKKFEKICDLVVRQSCKGEVKFGFNYEDKDKHLSLKNKES